MARLGSPVTGRAILFKHLYYKVTILKPEPSSNPNIGRLLMSLEMRLLPNLLLEPHRIHLWIRHTTWGTVLTILRVNRLLFEQ